MDQEEVRERSEARVQIPWSGYWYVNVGQGPSRSWEDARQYGFLAAGGDSVYSDPLKRLGVGAQVLAYQKGAGYVRYGMVTQPAQMANDFEFNGKKLLDPSLHQPGLGHHRDDPERAEWLVGIDWKLAVPLAEAKTFPGVFANPNVVCKLRHQPTIDFLKKEF